MSLGHHVTHLILLRTNAQNDAILYKLVHTKLLSGAANTELNLTPAQRKRAMMGRVMELAGSSHLGKGERAEREAERNKAAKRVREGMLVKQSQREKQQLEEVCFCDRCAYAAIFTFVIRQKTSGTITQL